MNKLETVEQLFRSISGVKEARVLSDDPTILRVAWEGRPHDYTEQVRDIRNQYEELRHVEVPEGKSDKTYDGMPIHYWSFEDNE